MPVEIVLLCSQYEDEDKSELSVIENLKKHLPWPLSMVGRLGEQQREETERYPDSIQSILSVVDPEEDSQYSRTTLYCGQDPGKKTTNN